MITEPSEFRQRLLEIQDSTEVTYTTLPSDEPRFIIDANSRTITIPPEFQFLGVKNDHNAETIYFEIDRYFDDEDLSKHACVVQFSNKNNSNDGGIYPVTTMDTTSVDGKIIFGWEIKSDVTSLVGDIYFSVRFYSIDSTDYIFTYNFNTLTAKSVILATLDVYNQMIIENYPSELDAWLDRMNELEAETSGKVDELKSDIDNKWAIVANGEIFELSTEEEPVKPVPCTGISLDKTKLTINDLESTVTLTATVEPFDTTDDVIWSINNEEVVTLVNGVIMPVANGNAVVTVTCGSYSATCDITVKIIASYTKTNLDGYFDFVDVEDGYFGTITNKATDGTLQGEIHNEVVYEQSAVYGGVKNGILGSGTSPYMGAIGSRVTLRVSKQETGIFYQEYPYTVEVYGAIHSGYSAEDTVGTGIYNDLKSAIMNTKYLNKDSFTGRGTCVYFSDASTIESKGSIEQGVNTFTLDTEIDMTQYHHYIVCVDSALVRLYVDGVMVGEGTATNNNLADASATLIPMMSGFIKMCRVYNAILTDEQVANNYSHTIGIYGGEA